METENSGQASSPSGPKNLQPPKVSVEFALSPEIHSLSEDIESPTLTITITSHATQPITVSIWGGFLHPSRAMVSMGYHIVDIDTRQRVYIPIEHVRRYPFPRRMGHPDQQFYWTLFPKNLELSPQPFISQICGSARRSHQPARDLDIQRRGDENGP